MTFQKSFLKRKNKFNAQKQKVGGVMYDSKMEASYAEQLEWRKKAGEITDIKRQHKIEIRVNGHLICNYYVDFLVTLADGTRQYHEVKGFSTDVFRMKWKLCMALKDEIDKDAGFEAEWIMVK
jgi:hypothetical protein